MSAKFIIFLAMVFIVGQFMCLVGEGGFFGQDDVDLQNTLTGYTALEVSGAGIWTVPKLIGGFLTTGLPKMITWNYSFLEGSWSMIKWFLLYPISIGVVWGITLVFMPVIQGIFSGARRLITGV